MNAIGTAIRLPAETVKKADALLKIIRKDAKVAAVGRVTRSTVLRMAIQRGLGVLEDEYNVKSKK